MRALGSPIGENLRSPCSFDGAFYALARNSTRDASTLRVMASEDLRAWREEAHLELTPGDPYVNSVLPLGSGNFILVAMRGTFNREGRKSFLALAKADASQRLQVQDLVDMGADLDKLIQDPGRMGFFFARAVPLRDGWLLTNVRTGHLWLVQRASGEGRVRAKALMLYPAAEAALKKGVRLEPPILALQPTREGDVLLAARSEKAMLEARATAETLAFEAERKRPQDTAGLTASQRASGATRQRVEETGSRDRVAAEDLTVKAYPEVQWFELSAATGKLRRVDLPGATGLLGGLADLQGFGFGFRPDGSLVMTPPPPMAKAK